MSEPNRQEGIRELVSRALAMANAGKNPRVNLVSAAASPVGVAAEFYRQLGDAFDQYNRRRRRQLMHRECHIHAFTADGSEQYRPILRHDAATPA